MTRGLEVAEIFRRHGEDWRAAQQTALDRGQRRVMGAIEACRTERLGGHVEACADCGSQRVFYNSCRNPQESPHSGVQMGPNILVKTGCCWSSAAKRAMSGRSLCSGMVGMSS